MSVLGVWDYNPDLSRPLDRLRFEVGDVFSTRQLLSNEEITYLLTVYGDSGDGFLEACAQACEKIAHRVAGDPNFQRGSWRQDRNAVVQNYLAMAERFRLRRGSGVVFTSTTPSVKPYFDVGMHDFPNTPPTMSRDDEPDFRP
jgi:hypothetical protein